MRYGLSQAILQAVALKGRKLMCEVLPKMQPAATAGTDRSFQSGDARYDHADKAIINGPDVLPHGLINHVQSKLGPGKAARVCHLAQTACLELGGEDYRLFCISMFTGPLGLAFQTIWRRSCYLTGLRKRRPR